MVHIIDQCIAVLQETATAQTNPHNFSKREAVLLLAHLVGDLHQPLHVGSPYLTLQGELAIPTADDLHAGRILASEGGNKLHINGTGDVMHSYWDADVVEAAMRATKTKTPADLALALLLAHPRPTPLFGDLPAMVNGWADESLEAARVAMQGLDIAPQNNSLTDANGGKTTGWSVTVPELYPQIGADVASERLLLAGKRLAALLQATLK